LIFSGETASGKTTLVDTLLGTSIEDDEAARTSSDVEIKERSIGVFLLFLRCGTHGYFRFYSKKRIRA
jgi:hypothetical protein